MIYEPFPLKFRGTKKMHYGPTDHRPRTDRPSYRDAWTHLKMLKEHALNIKNVIKMLKTA